MNEVTDINSVMQQETLTFGEALKEVVVGKKIRRLEWKDANVYGMLKDGRLSIFIDGKMNNWIVNDVIILASSAKLTAPA